MPWANVEAIEHPEVGIADDLKPPQQCKAERAADAADDFQSKLAAAQWLYTNFDACFFFRGFHQDSE